jgi:hypothetical protein
LQPWKNEAIVVRYRAIGTDYETGSGNRIFYDATVHGPLVGIDIRCLTLWFCLSLFIAISAEAQTMISDNPAAEQELGVHLYENELDYSIALQPWKGDYDGMIQHKMMNWDL